MVAKASGAPQAATYAAEMVALEEALAHQLQALHSAVADHRGAAEALATAGATAQRHVEALRSLPAAEPQPAHTARRENAGASGTVGTAAAVDAPAEGLHAASAALWDAYTALQRAAMGYQRMWTGCSRLGHPPSYNLAAAHMRDHAAAAVALVPLLSHVMVWELTQAGHDCQCACTGCGGLGTCLCSPAASVLLQRALRDAVPGEPDGVPVEFLRPTSPSARAGMQTGDRIVQANGEPVADPWQLLRRVGSFRDNGTPAQLVVERAGAATPITVTP